jgi:DNA-directed RNA polymerase subunit RPC12/RpoP
MSYIQFQQKCLECGKTWNAAFGIVGMTQIAASPKVCPHCQSERVEKHADGWADIKKRRPS